jgi:hypothetical protein
MIKIENTDVYGWEAAIRGARNPMNSWDKSDSVFFDNDDGCTCAIGQGVETSLIELGPNDHKLLRNLTNAGPDHGKFMRMITVSLDITAPLYWWKEFDTYKVGTVANSCSTMHKIHAKEFTLDDFSHEHLIPESVGILKEVIGAMNDCRDVFINYDRYKAEGIFKAEFDKKTAWWQMIQLLPTSYNQRRTVLLNYQVLKSMYHARKNHKLDEWHTFCDWIRSLPYSELITNEG